jgi:23S rRNA (uracil1939-C5)-methyltransferase
MNEIRQKEIRQKEIKNDKIKNDKITKTDRKQNEIKKIDIKNNAIKKSNIKNNTINKIETKKSDTKKMDAKKIERKQNEELLICPVVKNCGGCQLQHISYEQQLKIKQKQVNSLLSKYGKVENIIGMKNPYYYRNKVHAVFDHDKKGNPIAGVYEPKSHRVVPVESCLIEDQKADAIIQSIRSLLKSFKIKTYDEDTGYGLLRHVLIRTGFTSKEIMVVLVLSTPIMPSKNNFVKALRDLHPEITTIIVNVNNKKTSMILGDKEQVIYGKGYIEDSLCGKVFKISPKSFYQVNPVQTEILYTKAIELAELTGKETIMDAYCGIGTIGIIASEKVKKVIGVELNKDAVNDAITNAKRNNVNNIDFYNKDAGEFMVQVAAGNQPVDVVFLDPPRAGSDEKFLNSLVQLAPKKVVYISCNPVTLERDLAYLTKRGYQAKKVLPVDMFPGTEHVEVITLLQKA